MQKTTAFINKHTVDIATHWSACANGLLSKPLIKPHKVRHKAHDQISSCFSGREPGYGAAFTQDTFIRDLECLTFCKLQQAIKIWTPMTLWVLTWFHSNTCHTKLQSVFHMYYVSCLPYMLKVWWVKTKMNLEYVLKPCQMDFLWFSDQELTTQFVLSWI